MPTALVCDDDMVARRVVEHVLTEGGFDVISSVETAVEAVTVAAAARPDLVVMDASLQGTSGIEVIPELLALGCEVVVFTAFDSAREQVQAAGALDAIPKTEVHRLEHLVADAARRYGAISA